VISRRLFVASLAALATPLAAATMRRNLDRGLI